MTTSPGCCDVVFEVAPAPGTAAMLGGDDVMLTAGDSEIVIEITGLNAKNG